MPGMENKMNDKNQTAKAALLVNKKLCLCPSVRPSACSGGSEAQRLRLDEQLLQRNAESQRKWRPRAPLAGSAGDRPETAESHCQPVSWPA